MNATEFDAKLLNLASAIRMLVLAGHLRQAILLRLCVAGLRLKDAVNYRLADLVTCGSEVLPNPALYLLGCGFDSYCQKMGVGQLDTLVVQYLDRANLLSKNAEGEYELELPAFPSRKGGHSITTRSAEREINYTWHMCCTGPVITFREARKLGKRLCNTIANKKAQIPNADVVLSVSTELNWFYKKLFPKDWQSRHDAKQTAILEVLEIARKSELPSGRDAIKVLLCRAIRRYQAAYIRDKRNCAYGVLNDWSTIGETNKYMPLQNRSEVRSRIAYALNTLSYREREIIKLRYGLSDGYTFSLVEVAHIFKISPERVRQIEIRGMRKLQKPNRAYALVNMLS